MSNGYAASSTIPVWTIGDRLRKARENADIGVQELADRLGVTRGTIGNYESGRRAISVDAVMAYAAETGVDVGWLLTGGEPPRSPDDEPASADRRSRVTDQ